jgi:hypothetical protein
MFEIRKSFQSEILRKFLSKNTQMKRLSLFSNRSRNSNPHRFHPNYFSVHKETQFFDDLKQRNLIEEECYGFVNSIIKSRTLEKGSSIYAGFDPTAGKFNVSSF